MMEDYKVHRKVCRKEEVERKKKGEKGERKEEGGKDAEARKEKIVMEVEKVFGSSPDPAVQAFVDNVAEALGKKEEEVD